MTCPDCGLDKCLRDATGVYKTMERLRCYALTIARLRAQVLALTLGKDPELGPVRVRLGEEKGAPYEEVVGIPIEVGSTWRALGTMEEVRITHISADYVEYVHLGRGVFGSGVRAKYRWRGDFSWVSRPAETKEKSE